MTAGLLHWNTSVLRAVWDTATSRAVLHEGPDCTTCRFVPDELQLTLANFADNCNTCFSAAGSYWNCSGAAAAVNNNTYSVYWNGIAGATCVWISRGGFDEGTFGTVIEYSDDICTNITGTDTFDQIKVELWFGGTPTIQIRLYDSGGGSTQAGGVHYLFKNTFSFTGNECDEIDGDNFSNELTSCTDNSPSMSVCGTSGDVTVDFIY